MYFHKWARAQLVAYGQTFPAHNQSQDAFSAGMVQRIISGVERGRIFTGQYMAVLIDEGHDFALEWLKLVTQMPDPTTHSLLVLYDDAQSIYERGRGKNFIFYMQTRFFWQQHSQTWSRSLDASAAVQTRQLATHECAMQSPARPHQTSMAGEQHGP